MPTNADFKKLVRARMSKTGEAYTAARAVLLKRTAPKIVSPIVTPPAVAAPAPAAAAAVRSLEDLAGVSDKAIQKATGCTWERWCWALDKAGALDWSHRAVAEYVQKTYKVSDWWSQTVTVGYERIKGLRAIGQRMSGAFEANKSKTIDAPAAKVSRAFSDSRVRAKWLPGQTVTIRKATAGKSVRMTWSDETSVEVWLVATPAGKTSVQLTHRKLTSKADVDARKAFWAERLSALKSLLEA
jgi:hypothetical protein